MSTAAEPPQKAAPKHPPKFLIWVGTGLIVPVLYIIQLVVVVKKSSSTSFQVLQAPERWSKSTTPVIWLATFYGGTLKDSMLLLSSVTFKVEKTY